MEESKKKLAKRVVIGIAGLIVLVAIVKGGKKDNGKLEAATSDATEQIKPVNLGEVLHTQYFDVIIKKAYTTPDLETGNQFTDKQADNGQTFIVLESSFTNTDSESRLMTEGKLILIKEGKEHLMEKSETIMLEGWGILLKNINPLSSLNTNIVYQIPDNFNGRILYEPARSDDRRIIVGDVDLTTE